MEVKELDSDLGLCETLNSLKLLLENKPYPIAECLQSSQILLNEITNLVKCDEQFCIRERFYDLLFPIILEENLLLCSCNVEDYALHLDFYAILLTCARNTLYKNPVGQMCVVMNEKYIHCLLSSLDFLFLEIEAPFRSQTNVNSEEINRCQIKASIACITCFTNLMAGSSSIRRIVWPNVKHKLKNLFASSLEVGQMSAAFLHQFLLEDELKSEIMVESEYFVTKLLDAYMEENDTTCFSLFCLTIFFASPGIVSKCWNALNSNQRILLVDILDSFFNQASKVRVDRATLIFLLGLFKKEADSIFSSHGHILSVVEPMVFDHILQFLCSAAASDEYREYLQMDQSLLIATLFLLKNLNMKENQSKNQHALEESCSSMDGFKRDIIRLLSSLIYQNKHNQDAVGEMDGVLLLLESSQYDEKNPLIKETCIFALRNLLENNRSNQLIVEGLALQGVTDVGLFNEES